MAYSDYEQSIESGSPAELFKFTYGDLKYNYCSGDENFTHEGELYLSSAIKRNSPEATEEIQRSSLEIRVPRGFPVVELFMAAPPEGVVYLTVFRRHRLDDEHLVFFKGRVMTCGYQDGEMLMTCEPIFTSLKRPGLRVVFDVLCPHGLYDTLCKVDKTNFQVTGSVLTIDHLNVVVQQSAGNHPDGWFNSGIFECGSTKRHIVTHVGSVLTLMHPIPINLVGKPCNIYPGCMHTRTDCHSKFNNILNHGACSWMPYKNPFTGDNIFFGG